MTGGVQETESKDVEQGESEREITDTLYTQVTSDVFSFIELERYVPCRGARNNARSHQMECASRPSVVNE